MCYILYFGGKLEALQVWEEGGLKLAASLFPLSFPSVAGIHPDLSEA